MSLLFQDLSGYIRLIVCDHMCKTEYLDFELNMIYTISNAEIRYLNKNYSTSEDQYLDMNYDLLFIEKTKIEPYPPYEQSSTSNFSSSQSFDLSNIVDSHQNLQNLISNLSSYDDLKYKTNKEFVNIIGIVHKIDKSAKIITQHDGSITMIKHFYLVTESRSSIICTLLSLVAESIKFQIGDILLIENCQLSDYGGLSVFLRKSSKIINLPYYIQNDIKVFKDLSEWWVKRWWLSRNDDYLKLTFKRPTEDESGNNNKRFRIN